MKKTFSIKPAEVERKWVLVDASEAPLGRVATTIATHLTGKYKPTYTPHIDGGDYVVVINSDKLVVTGNKLKDKKYYRYSGFPSGLKEATLSEVIEKDSTKAITAAVKGMLPKNKLSPERIARLRIFKGEEYEHTAQKPQKISLSASKKTTQSKETK